MERKQIAIQNLLEEDLRKHISEKVQGAEKVQPPPDQKEQKKIPKPLIKVEPPKDKEQKGTQKLFPKSPLFEHWGKDLSEDDQKEAQALFEKYGYNAFLSDRLPLDRALPDTRDPR